MQSSAALIGTHAAGFGLRYQLGWRRLSEVAFFLGCLFYGAAIWLLAQIFHITSSNYDGLWWWAIGCLPFALLLDTVLLHLLFAGLLALWVGFEVLSLESLIWGIPNGGVLTAAVSRAGALVGVWQELGDHRRNLRAAPGLVGRATADRLETTSEPDDVHRCCRRIDAARSGVAPRRGARWRSRTGSTASRLVGATLIPLSFHQFNESVANNAGVFRMDRDHLRLGGLEEMIPIVILLAATLILAVFLELEISWEREPVSAFAGGVSVGTRPGGSSAIRLARAVRLPSLYVPTVKESWTPTILANVAMVAVSLWLIRFGLTVDQGRPFGSGGCVPVVVDRAPLRGPVRRLRRDARRVPDVLSLRRSAAREWLFTGGTGRRCPLPDYIESRPPVPDPERSLTDESMSAQRRRQAPARVRAWIRASGHHRGRSLPASHPGHHDSRRDRAVHGRATILCTLSRSTLATCSGAIT